VLPFPSDLLQNTLAVTQAIREITKSKPEKKLPTHKNIPSKITKQKKTPFSTEEFSDFEKTTYVVDDGNGNTS